MLKIDNLCEQKAFAQILKLKTKSKRLLLIRLGDKLVNTCFFFFFIESRHEILIE